MEHWLSHLRTWLYQIWRPVYAIKLGTEEEILSGLLKILGVLGLGILIVMICSRTKPQKMVRKKL